MKLILFTLAVIGFLVVWAGIWELVGRIIEHYKRLKRIEEKLNELQKR